MPDNNVTTHDSEFGSVLGSYANIEELVRRIREHDKDAEQFLYDRYVRRLIGLVRENTNRIYATRFSSESVVQSAMASVFVRMRKGEFDFRRSGQLWHLLAAIAMNKLREKIRSNDREKRDVRREQRGDSGLFGSVHGIPLAELVEAPNDEEMREFREEVEVALAKCTPRERFIITLSLQGNSNNKVAEKVQASGSYVRQVLRNFKDDLEARLKSAFSECGGQVP